MLDLNSLNEAQRKAVVNTEGPVMILAGAGSGKTRTLVSRISYLIEELNVSPFQVLALTFSNKAAREMRDRISTQVSSDLGALQITTFHAFCARVLRSEAEYIGLSRNFTIYDTSESKAIAKTILGRHGVSQKETSPFEILYYIDDIKNNGHYTGRENTVLDIDKDDIFHTYYTEYEAELLKANALDFGGLIVGIIQLFEKFPKILEKYQERFRYILVDEYQDTNHAQLELVKMLSANNQNICVVGDEDQSIYSWRGADIKNILNFEDIFPKAHILKLEQNYRSSKNIIEAATCVISRNSMRKGKTMWTDNPVGENIDIIECYNDKEEAEYIAKEIKKLHRENVPSNEIAVFYRTNTQSRLIEDNLRKYNIPYRVVGGIKFYDRKEIKDMLAYIRAVVNGKDSLAVSRVVNVPARGVGATTLRKLEEESIRHDSSLWETINKVVAAPEEYKHIRLSTKVKSSLGIFANLINEVKASEQGSLPSSLYEKLLHESGYYELLKISKDYESMARLENLDELSSAIQQYENSVKKPTLSGFLETITLDTSIVGEEVPAGGEVSLMTVHGAKGLEFLHAFLVGAEEKVFPSYRSLDDGESGIEEERRLFYVAMTRAMDKLYITFAQGRVLFGKINFNGPSRFLNEIPERYYRWIKFSGGQRKTGGDWSKLGGDWSKDSSFDDFSQVSKDEDDGPIYQVADNRVVESTFSRGANVVHALYGRGVIIDTEGIGGEEKVVIKFIDGARKKFMVKFAPIELI